MKEEQKIKIQAVKGFLKMFSCSQSMLMTFSEFHDTPVSRDLLKAMIGFSAGISTMGDICGMFNGGAVVLGQKLTPTYASEEEQWKIALACHIFFKQTKEAVGTCSCGEIHGGKHLAKNFRKAILTGKAMKCFEMLYKGMGHLDDLLSGDQVLTIAAHFDQDTKNRICDTYRFFQYHDFHCCRSTLQLIQKKTGKDMSSLYAATAGFIGGIGFSGTACGAMAGGIMAIGLKYGVDPADGSYKDLAKIVYHGLLKSDKIYTDEKVFKAAKAFDYCQRIYKSVEEKYGSCDCRAITGLDIDKPSSVEAFRGSTGIRNCRNISESIAGDVAKWL